ncbi:MAG: type IIA DNA topoisomerase subunit B [Chloroflexi bacterium]|nr:type IIA DNA topoisomerase subunit B [Chloroflexota bacterium]
MYIGSTSTSGLVHLLWEALDNAVDEAVAGEGTQIWVEVDQSGVVTVTDQGRGMPFDLMTYGGKKLPAATVLLTVPHSGGKFGEGAYKTAGGLHGVGATVINALSEWLELDVWRDGQHFTQRFERGKPLAHRVEPTKEKKRGTRIRWSYDRTIFEHDAYYPRETIERRMQAAAHLNRGLSLHLSMWDDEQEAVITRTFYSKEGLAEFVKQATPPGAEPLFSKPITFVQMRDEVHVEVALLPNRGYKLDLHSFANAVRTPEGGVHERGFRAALTRVANDYAARMGIIKNRDKEAFKPEVIQQGLVAAISVKLKDPQFEGQTKNKLNNAPVEGIVRSVVLEGLKEWFDARPAQARDWLKKIQDDQRLANRLEAEERLARTGQRREQTVDLDTSKFARASTNDPDRAELFVVEGQSAGGNAKQGRDASYQAILALRGKPINVINARPERLQLNKEYALLASVIGTGVRGAFNLEKCRYSKIILMTDADVDGGHIRALLLALFYQEMPGLIEAGRVFVAMPPLYSVRHKGKPVWLIDDDALRRFLARNAEAKNAPIKRYKGLGEMTASELRETTMHPATRVLKQVTLEDSAIAAQVVADLMDESRPEARREFLAQAARLTDLDV